MQSRLKFLKQKFFNYKARVIKSINKISSKLSQLQLLRQDIRELEVQIDLNMAFMLINLMDNEFYIIVKYYPEDMRNVILGHTIKRLKLVKQKIKEKTKSETKTASKAFSKYKKKLFCFHYNKLRYIKIKFFK